MRTEKTLIRLGSLRWAHMSFCWFCLEVAHFCLQMLSVDLCCSDTIMFYDGPDPTSPLLYTVGQTTQPGDMVTSTTNTVYIHMQLLSHWKCRGAIMTYRSGKGLLQGVVGCWVGLYTVGQTTQPGDMVTSTTNTVYIHMQLLSHWKCRGAIMTYRSGKGLLQGVVGCWVGLYTVGQTIQPGDMVTSTTNTVYIHMQLLCHWKCRGAIMTFRSGKGLLQGVVGCWVGLYTVGQTTQPGDMVVSTPNTVYIHMQLLYHWKYRLS